MKAKISILIAGLALVIGYVLGLAHQRTAPSASGAKATSVERDSLPWAQDEPSPPSRATRSGHEPEVALDSHELAMSKVASMKSLGLSDMRAFRLTEEELDELNAVSSRSLERLKEIELKYARPASRETGEQVIEIKPFPDEYAAWRSQLVGGVEDVVGSIDALIVVAAIENELGHGAGFGSSTRHVWTIPHPDSTETYVLRTEFLDSSGATTSGWSQTHLGSRAPTRYDHVLDNGETSNTEP